MPPPLSADQVTYADGTERSVENYVRGRFCLPDVGGRAEDDGPQGIGLQGSAVARPAVGAALPDQQAPVGRASKARRKPPDLYQTCTTENPAFWRGFCLSAAQIVPQRLGGLANSSSRCHWRQGHAIRHQNRTSGKALGIPRIVGDQQHQASVSAARSRTSSRRSVFSAGPSAAKGSSSNTMGRSCNSTRPRAARPCCPPDRSAGRRSPRPDQAQAGPAQQRPVAAWLALSRWPADRARPKFCVTVRCGNRFWS